MRELTKNNIEATSFTMLFMGAIILPFTLSTAAVIYFKDYAQNMNHKILKQDVAPIIFMSLLGLSLLVIGGYLFSVVVCESKTNPIKLLTNKKLQEILKEYLQKKLRTNERFESDVDTGSVSIEGLKDALGSFISDIESLKDAIQNSEERFEVCSNNNIPTNGKHNFHLSTYRTKDFLVRDVDGVIKYQEIIKDRAPGGLNKNGTLRDSQKMQLNAVPVTFDELQSLMVDRQIEIIYTIINPNALQFLDSKESFRLIYICKALHKEINCMNIDLWIGGWRSNACNDRDRNKDDLQHLQKLTEMALNNKSMKAELITHLDEIIKTINQEKTNLQDKIQKNPWKLDGIKEISLSDVKKTARSFIPCLG